MKLSIFQNSLPLSTAIGVQFISPSLAYGIHPLKPPKEIQI
jgi:hypothetical protein